MTPVIEAIEKAELEKNDSGSIVARLRVSIRRKPIAARRATIRATSTTLSCHSRTGERRHCRSPDRLTADTVTGSRPLFAQAPAIAPFAGVHRLGGATVPQRGCTERAMHSPSRNDRRFIHANSVLHFGKGRMFHFNAAGPSVVAIIIPRFRNRFAWTKRSRPGKSPSRHRECRKRFAPGARTTIVAVVPLSQQKRAISAASEVPEPRRGPRPGSGR